MRFKPRHPNQLLCQGVHVVSALPAVDDQHVHIARNRVASGRVRAEQHGLDEGHARREVCNTPLKRTNDFLPTTSRVKDLHRTRRCFRHVSPVARLPRACNGAGELFEQVGDGMSPRFGAQTLKDSLDRFLRSLLRGETSPVIETGAKVMPRMIQVATRCGRAPSSAGHMHVVVLHGHHDSTASPGILRKCRVFRVTTVRFS